MTVVINGTSGITFPNGVTQANGTSAPVTTAQGGTGLSSPGTSGNVLTSDGTNWTSTAPSGGVTSLNGATGAITTTTAYALGSFVTGRPQNGTNYAVSSTVAGSSLYATSPNLWWNTTSSAWRGPSGSANTNEYTLVNTGSWRCVSPAGQTGDGFGDCGLWVRYA